MTLDLVLLVLALFCFLAAALEFQTPRVNLVALGLFLALLTVVV
jgi:hypothetical protein